MGRHTAVNRRKVTLVSAFSGVFTQPRKNSEARSSKQAATKRAKTGLGRAAFKMEPTGLMVSYAPNKLAASRKAAGKLQRRVIPRTIKTTFSGKRKRWS